MKRSFSKSCTWIRIFNTVGKTRSQYVDIYAHLKQNIISLHFTSLCNEPKKNTNGKRWIMVHTFHVLLVWYTAWYPYPRELHLLELLQHQVPCLESGELIYIVKYQLLPKSKWKSHPPGSPVGRKGDKQKYTYHHIRPYVFPVTCQHFACSSYACLDLIINHQNVVPRTEVSNRFQIAIWWEYYLQSVAIA
jgi:hypothetical protein